MISTSNNGPSALPTSCGTVSLTSNNNTSQTSNARRLSLPCRVDIFLQPDKLWRHFYTVDVYNSRAVKFSCLHNYHLSSGDLTLTCLPNGSWSGMEPVCEVDYYKEKLRLSSAIILGSLLVPIFLLGLDFARFLRERAKSYSQKDIDDKQTITKADLKSVFGCRRCRYLGFGASFNQLQAGLTNLILGYKFG
ncbi:hypothetical protein PoB_000574900 [Plakobranchus ocellatus]|uniref:Sushi domain-containing protein n=1 Tax=Plakobranchus ocellatus TaxID=259542 RepID=A0AAV3Y8I8_9GAST|nr:hypothetical protein PoB_000574900 [Plakobranchus ocellatus]